MDKKMGICTAGAALIAALAVYIWMTPQLGSKVQWMFTAGLTVASLAAGIVLFKDKFFLFFLCQVGVVCIIKGSWQLVAYFHFEETTQGGQIGGGVAVQPNILIDILLIIGGFGLIGLAAYIYVKTLPVVVEETGGFIDWLLKMFKGGK